MQQKNILKAIKYYISGKVFFLIVGIIWLLCLLKFFYFSGQWGVHVCVCVYTQVNSLKIIRISKLKKKLAADSNQP